MSARRPDDNDRAEPRSVIVNANVRRRALSTMPKITIQDVARDAKVSAMTVSRVINQQAGVGAATRERVLEAVTRLGYRRNSLARGLKARVSNTIGLVVPDITNPYFPEIVRGAEDVALEAGYGVFLSNAVEDVEREVSSLQRMEERRVDGVIVVSPRTPEDRLLELLRAHPASVVVNRSVPNRISGSVRLDNADGMRQAVEHLVGLGRERFALLMGPVASHASTERLDQATASLDALGLAPPANWVVRAAPYMADGARAARQLLAPYAKDATGGPDALLCHNDLLAAGALGACSELGIRVPEDLAVVGFDDIPFASMFTPALTTLHVPKYELGATAMRMLLGRMGGQRTQAERTLRPTLVVRGSTEVRTS